MIRAGLFLFVPGAVALALPAGALEIAEPRPGSEHVLTRPVIRVSGTPPPGTTRGSLRFVLDGIDVSEFARWGAAGARLVPPLPLAPGEHAIEVLGPGAAAALARSSFRTRAPGRGALLDLHYADSTTLALTEDEDDRVSFAPHLDGSRTGACGTLSIDATWTPRLALQGPQEDLVAPNAVLSFDSDHAGAAAGTLAETRTFEGSAFLGTRTHRKAAEARLTAGGLGTLLLYTNLGDALPGSGGEDSAPQWIHGLAWRAPLGERPSLTLALERVATRADGEGEGVLLPRVDEAWIAGARLVAKLSGSFAAEAELARADRTVEDRSARDEGDGTAIRVGVKGVHAGHKIEAAWTRVASRYRNPADPGLRADRAEGLLALSRSEKRWNYRLRLSWARDGLEDGLPRATERRVALGAGAVLPGEVQLRAETELQDVDAAGGGRRQARHALGVGRSFRALRLELGAARSETEGSDPRREVLSRSIKAAARWSGRGPWSVGAGASRERRDDSGTLARAASLYLEPAWRAPGDRFLAGLALSRATRRSPGRSDSEQSSARGSFALTLPRASWATLGLDLSFTRLEDRLRASRERDWRVALKLVLSPDWRLRRGSTRRGGHRPGRSGYSQRDGS